MTATATLDTEESTPGEQDRIIRQGATRRLVRSVWGLGVTSTDGSGAGTLINARAESLLVTPAFRSLVPQRRCVIPATAFYEFTGRGKARRTLVIHRVDGQPLALPGLWTARRDPRTGEEHLSHVVITASANALMRPFKHRVPVVLLDRAAIDRWLDPTVTDPSHVLPLLGPAPDDLLVATPLSSAISGGQRDDAQLSLPLNGV